MIKLSYTLISSFILPGGDNHHTYKNPHSYELLRNYHSLVSNTLDLIGNNGDCSYGNH